MMRMVTFPVLMTLILQLAAGQVSYLERPDLMNRVDSCLQHTYDFSFAAARRFQRELQGLTPTHPAPPFLEALIVYWENFPLLPDDRASENFIELMDRSIDRSRQFIDISSTHLEGVFFDLFGRAFKAMFWADNGRASKVLPDLRTMYRHTKEGFDLKAQFNEFYFSTGLYNYYIEAYPEAHPIYKPMLSFMQDGNKNEGLRQLNYAINETVYLKVEAMLFMSLIQLNYEKDLNTAAIYAERLHREYPHNIYYQGHLVTILLHQHRYNKTREVLETMQSQDDIYSGMIRNMAAAFMAEKVAKNYRSAEEDYLRIVEMAGLFGPFADKYKAIGYMGLSRVHSFKGNESEARRYARIASRYTTYPFILEE